jgi:hypothetical protein
MPRYVLSKGALAVERDEPKISATGAVPPPSSTAPVAAALDADGALLHERRHAIARLPRRSAPLLDFYLAP